MLRALAAITLFVASIANAQAVAPMPTPVRPPLVRPVVNDPYFPTPGATPAGAGIVVPTREGGEQVVPRSPNTRVLPASKDPGVWAADGAPKAAIDVGKVNVLGVVFNVGPDVGTWYVAGECASDLNEAKSIPHGWAEIVSKFSEGALRCISAKALLYCASATEDELRKGSRMYTRLRLDGAIEAKRRAEALEREHCGDKNLNPQQTAYLMSIQSTWGGVHMRRIRQEEGK